MKIIVTINGDIVGIGRNLLDIRPDLASHCKDPSYLALSETELDKVIHDGPFIACECDAKLKDLHDRGHLDSLMDREDVFIGMDGCLTVGSASDIHPRALGDYPLSGRVKLFSQHWDRLKPHGDTFDAILEEQDALHLSTGWSERTEATKINDATITMYLKQTEPLWNVYNIKAEAAILIERSRVECAHVPLKPLLLVAKKGCTLFGLVNEICVIKDGEAWCLNYSMRIASNLAFSGAFLLDDVATDQNGVYFDVLTFIRKFLALQACERSPIVTQTQVERRLSERGIRAISRVTHTQVSLSKRYRSVMSKHGKKALDRDGKELAVVEVSGFVREQVYGPGRSQRKTIWVDGFTRGQWVRRGVRIVTVKE